MLVSILFFIHENLKIISIITIFIELNHRPCNLIQRNCIESFLGMLIFIIVDYFDGGLGVTNGMRFWFKAISSGFLSVNTTGVWSSSSSISVGWFLSPESAIGEAITKAMMANRRVKTNNFIVIALEVWILDFNEIILMKTGSILGPFQTSLGTELNDVSPIDSVYKEIILQRIFSKFFYQISI